VADRLDQASAALGGEGDLVDRREWCKLPLADESVAV
jgi:hypothetical protein